jgi:hypothetical protein
VASRRGAPQSTSPDGPVDLYTLLEVSPNARPEVIQAAYKVLARAWHPDVNPSPEAAQRIRELNAAYAVLSDTQRRAGYDLQRVRLRRRAQLLGQTDGVAATFTPASPRSANVLTLSSRRQSSTLVMSDRSTLGQIVLVVAALIAFIAVLVVLVWLGMALTDDGAVDQSVSVVQVRLV